MWSSRSWGADWRCRVNESYGETRRVGFGGKRRQEVREIGVDIVSRVQKIVMESTVGDGILE